MAKNTVELKRTDNKQRITLALSGKIDLLSKIASKLHAAEWDSTLEMWTVPNNKLQVDEIFKVFKNKAWVEVAGLYGKKKAARVTISPQDAPINKAVDPVPQEALDYFTEFLTARNYSLNTIRSYVSILKSFLYHNEKLDHRKLGIREIRSYMQHMIHHKNASTSYQNQVINALKCYYENIIGMDKIFVAIERPMKEKRLPEIFSQGELKRIFKSVKNLKHLAMLLVIYSAGLRAGELTALKISDIKSDRMQIFVRGGKGKKDRLTILSETALKTLRLYYKEYKPEDYLFEGMYGDRYSQTSLRKVYKRALKRAGIKRHATLHTLRHTFATHLLEQHTNLRYIQDLLGHNSPKTTEIYTHITKKGLDKIINPLDQMDL